MAWLRELSVKSGNVWFKPGVDPSVVSVEGFLDLSEPYWIWFQDIDRSVPFASPDPSRKYGVKKGHIALEPRLEPDDPQPEGLLEFWQRLLCPKAEEGQEWYGYVFSAHLPLEMGEPLTVRFKDTTFWGREGTFVELVHHEPPYLLVAHDRKSVVAAKDEEFELMLRLKCRWPLEG
jgi:hypothetical protein